MQEQKIAPNKALLVTGGVVLLAVAILAVFGIIDSSRNKGANQQGAGTAETAEATPDPYTVMASLIGDWQQTPAEGKEPSGIIALNLHGDNTAVYTVKDVFDEEPRSINTRWQAVNGELTLVTEGSEATVYTFELAGDTLTLHGGYGGSVTFARGK